MAPSQMLKILLEEIPLGASGSFIVPVHTRLLEESASIPPGLALDVFPETFTTWRDSVVIPREGERDVIDEALAQSKVLCSPNPKGGYNLMPFNWDTQVETRANGFASRIALAVGGGAGEATLATLSYQKGRSLLRMREEELARVRGDSGEELYVLQSMSSGSYSAALLLRRWVVNYTNAARESLGL